MATGNPTTWAPRKPRGVKGNESQAVGGGKAPIYEVGQDKPYDTRSLPGKFKVSLPHGQIKVRPGCVPIPPERP